jgi:GT2 family glycosyltransferase
VPLRSPESGGSIGLCIVVVLYQCAIGDSPTCLSLSKQTSEDPHDLFLVYDNSPRSNLGSVPAGWEVVIDSNNGGLLAAYGCALSRAKAAGCPWILLLDQDTELPHDFLTSVHASLALLNEKTEVAAIVPIVKEGNRQLSPMLPRLGRERPFCLRGVIETGWLMAINSGACVRVDFIESIGGFSRAFWLDYLDHWLFKTLHDQGKSVFVSDVVLQHELSVANMNRGLTVQRYKNVLGAERQFTNGHLPVLWRLVLVPRLLARALKHLAVTRDKRLAFLMIAAAAIQVAALIRIGWAVANSAQTPATKE